MFRNTKESQLTEITQLIFRSGSKSERDLKKSPKEENISWASSFLSRKTRDNKESIYPSSPEIMQGMELYKANPELYSMHDRGQFWDEFDDIFIYKDDKGKVQNLAKCTPDGWCDDGFYQVKESKLEGKKLCERHCKDFSHGTNKLKVLYEFDKKYLDEYVSLHPKIIRFVESFVHEKK